MPRVATTVMGPPIGASAGSGVKVLRQGVRCYFRWPRTSLIRRHRRAGSAGQNTAATRICAGERNSLPPNGARSCGVPRMSVCRSGAVSGTLLVKLFTGHEIDQHDRSRPHPDGAVDSDGLQSSAVGRPASNGANGGLPRSLCGLGQRRTGVVRLTWGRTRGQPPSGGSGNPSMACRAAGAASDQRRSRPRRATQVPGAELSTLMTRLGSTTPASMKFTFMNSPNRAATPVKQPKINPRLDQHLAEGDHVGKHAGVGRHNGLQEGGIPTGGPDEPIREARNGLRAPMLGWPCWQRS